MPASKKRYDILLGSFVVLGLALLLAVVFLIGRERKLFDSTTELKAHFPNVAGLAIGADIMLAGVVVGHVRGIQFPKLVAKDESLARDVIVQMDISDQYMEWIKEDSIARIDSKGLLGDKLLNITIGSPEFRSLSEGDTLKSLPAMDFNKSLAQAQEALKDVTETIIEIKNIFKGFNQDGGDKALASAVKSLAQTLENTASITKDIKEKDGLLHALVYEGGGSKTVKSLTEGLNDLAHIINEVKSGQGIAHDLIYTNDQGQMLRSLTKASLDLETVAADLKNGKGSLGLLLKDPGIYNELYGLLGDLNRNSLLKAVIRYGISHPKKEN